jgi:hypothetical protein
MAVDIKSILNAGVAAQAASLAISNVPKKRKKKSLVKQGIGNIVGISLIQAESQMIGGI